ncbi:MAG TPA: alpha/beta hydrolase [Kofleriaceae bacterium]|nr:alpha/beta hydrolase [Kofleriaceae bacterium]
MSLFLSADGTPIHAAVSGQGPPLLLIHGTSADHTRWNGVRAELESSFTVHAMDRRGRGGSGDSTDYSITREFHDVAAVIATLGHDALVLGHSYGAICALEASLLAPPAKLVLYEPPIRTGDAAAPDMLVAALDALLEAGDRDGVVATFLREVVRMPPAELDVLRGLPAWEGRVRAAHTLPRELRASNAYVFDPARFAELRVPTLVLAGGASPPYFRNAADAVVAALPDARLAILPDQQHAAMDTARELFLREVTSFLG